MKRILALIMVLAMVFAFAACKSKDDGATTTDPSSAGGEVIDNGEGSTPVDASAADSTDESITIALCELDIHILEQSFLTKSQCYIISTNH